MSSREQDTIDIYAVANQAGLSVESLQEVICTSSSILQDIVQDLLDDEWELIALRLKMTKQQISGIKSDNSTLSLQKVEFLRKWRERQTDLHIES